MLIFKRTCTLLLSTLFMSAIATPAMADIKDNHFRFENFIVNSGPTKERIHLMCYRQKPTSWSNPKQYLSGDHNLWVKATVIESSVQDSDREAIVNFQVNLAPNKSYMLNRTIDNDNISIWIEEVDTGKKVSETINTKLQRPLIYESNRRIEQCRSGTI